MEKSTQKTIAFEVCCPNLESVCNATGAFAALPGGFGEERGYYYSTRIELCSALSLGGITPSYGLIKEARNCCTVAGNSSKIKLNVLIRCREGDFLYSDSEIALMCEEIRASADNGADGVVVGALTPDGRVDIPASGKMVELAHKLGLQVTFHRAIDRSQNILQALEDVVSLGAERILTSGGAESAYKGLGMIAKMNGIAGGRVSIMPGAGVNPANAREIITKSGSNEIHFSASAKYPSPMIYRGGVSFTPDILGGDFTRLSSSEKLIKETIFAVLG